MSFVLLGVGAWILVTGLLCCLGRAAALGDRERLQSEPSASAGFHERRDGSNRRGSGRAWAAESPGRRREDALERELAEARRALEQAEARLERAEARYLIA